jgi:hypothetical protein
VSGPTSSLLTGLGEQLAAAGAGTWRTTGAYTDGETAIVLGRTPEGPDRVIALASYPVDDDPQIPVSVLGVQVRCRGTADPRVADDLADSVFDLWHGAMNVLVGDVRVVQILRQSSTPLGQDQSGRWERSDNYYFTVQRPGRNRPES